MTTYSLIGQKVDYINIGLLIISLVLAFALPFRLFLFAYAVLGPLHYLTEINWLHDKKYFVDNLRWIWAPVICALLVLVPKVVAAFTGGLPSGESPIAELILIIDKYNNGFIFFAFVLAAALVFCRNRIQFWIIVISGVILSVLLNSVPAYTLVIGLLVPTLVHVYVFTLLFMLYGALRSQSKPGFAAVVLHSMAPLLIALVFINPEMYNFTEGVRSTFFVSGFDHLNSSFGDAIGFKGEERFSFESAVDIRIQIFIAFAYTYHYLNWFSKTAVIGWHKSLTSRRSVAIIILWACSVLLFIYDYSIGLVALLALSMLHVFLEFPLNFLSIQGIGKAFAIAPPEGQTESSADS